MIPIETIDRLIAELNSLLPMKPEYQLELDKKIRLEFSFNSNHIEGNTLTYGETELLLIFDKTTGNHELREYEEMKAHDVAFEVVKDWAKDQERPLNEAALKNLHQLLLVRPFWKEAMTPDGQPTRRLIETGAYKKQPNSVRLQNGELFQYASPEDTPVQMGELIEWFRAEDETAFLHPIVLAAMLHYRFVRIHPFDDGNGRMSRLLMNYVLLKAGLPPVIIQSADKKAYLFALNQADAGNLNAFIEYIAEQLVRSLELFVRAAKGESIEEAGDLQKEIALLKKNSQQSKIVKHPEVVCRTFIETRKTIWNAVLLTVNDFKGLYAEMKEVHTVNGWGEQFPEKNSLTAAFMISTKPEGYQIFGHDVHEDDIRSVEWHLTLYGIQSKTDNTEIVLKLTLLFSKQHYSITILLGNETVGNYEKDYGTGVLDSDIENLKSKLGKALLTAFKSRMEA